MFSGMFSWTLLLQHVYHLTYSIKPQPYQSLPKVLNFNKIHQLKLSRSDIFLVIHQLKHRYNGKHSQGQPTHSTFISTILLSMTEIKKMPSRIPPPPAHYTLSDTNYKILQMQPFSKCKGIVYICEEQLFFMLPNS